MNVGIRELKAHLSEYVGKAAAGERTVLCTFDIRQAQAARSAGLTVVGV